MSSIEVPRFSPVTAIVGAFGSGKTEVAVNYALLLAADGETVRIADLDIANPYFRSREAKQELESRGVQVVVPQGGEFYADLPIVLPQIRGLLHDGRGWTILDIGGDDLGARVLSSLHDLFHEGEYALLMVLNGNRPFTGTREGCLEMIQRIQVASRLRVTGLVANTHLMAETTLDALYRGVDLVGEVSRASGIPIAFAAIEERFFDLVDQAKLGCPVLPLARRMLPPWQEMIPPRLSILRRKRHA